MNTSQIQRVILESELDSTSKFIGVILALHFNVEKKMIRVRYDTISRMSGYAKRSIQRASTNLCACGIFVKKTTGRSNIYYLGPVFDSLMKSQKVKEEREAADKFYDSWEWKRVRYMAIKRSNGCCEACGTSGKNVSLVVDHIKPRAKFPELALSLDNLQVLCKDCNMGKGRWDETDWRQ